MYLCMALARDTTVITSDGGTLGAWTATISSESVNKICVQLHAAYLGSSLIVVLVSSHAS